MDLIYETEAVNYKKCGFYIINKALASERPGQHILAPLISSEYDVEIVNAIANVSLTQSYSNPTDKFLEFEYNFPINPAACIYRFVASFGNTRIEGIVK